MPMDMRDAIAHYLAYTGGQMPQGGFPGMGGGMPMSGGWVEQPPGGWPPGQPVPSDTGPFTPSAGPPPGAPFGRGGQALPLQAYQQLPSGQYLPDMLSDTYPGMPQTPSSPDYTGPQPTQMPPTDTPMQAPPIGQAGPVPGPTGGPQVSDMPGMAPGGQTVAGMDPNEWLRMYRGGTGGAPIPGLDPFRGG